MDVEDGTIGIMAKGDEEEEDTERFEETNDGAVITAIVIAFAVVVAFVSQG